MLGTGDGALGEGVEDGGVAGGDGLLPPVLGGVLDPPVFDEASVLTVASPPPPPPLLLSAAIVPTTATPIKTLVQMLIPVALAFSLDVPSPGRSGARLCDCPAAGAVR